MSSFGVYNSCLEVNLDIIRENVEKIRRHIGPEHGMIGVVKGDGYGLGGVEIACMLVEECGFDILAVAHVCEGIELRGAGIPREVDILVMSAFPNDVIPAMVEYDLQPVVFLPDTVERLDREAARQGKRVRVHIKVETGMNRIGARPGEELAALIDALGQAAHVDIDGIFTHFATTKDYDDRFAFEQFDRFREGLAQAEAAGIRPRYVHTANTGATVWFKECYGTHVRCAGLFLGYSKMNDRSNPIGVREAAAWRASITNLRTIQVGETVGYSRFFRPESVARVAVIGVGYVDGLHRDLAMIGGPVLVNGMRARYVGICMDQCFIDVTGIPCEIGDTVTMIGGDGDEFISPLDLMAITPSSTCASFFTSISGRAARRFIRNETV